MAKDTSRFPVHPKGVCGVVNDFQVINVGDFLDGLDITGMSITVNWHDRRGLGRYRGFYFGRVNIESLRTNIDKHGLDAVPQK